MKKIPTIFVRDWEGTIGPPGRFVLDEPHPDCGWVFVGEGTATRKLDGTCCLVREGQLFKRFEVKAGKPTPEGFDAVETDEETGNTVGWVPVGDGPEDRWHREAWEAVPDEVKARAHGRPVRNDGTYELVGPKVQGNPEGLAAHELVPHIVDVLELPGVPTGYEGLRAYFSAHPFEGIVWHHPDGRMAKIKAKDFGIKRGIEHLGGGEAS